MKCPARIYHLIPPEEIQLYDFTSKCLCEPEFEVKGHDFWLGQLLGYEIYQHHPFSPLERERLDFVVAGEKIHPCH